MRPWAPWIRQCSGIQVFVSLFVKLLCFRLGSLLGLSVCLSAMCTDSKMDTRVHVTSMYETLTRTLESEEQTDASFTVRSRSCSHGNEIVSESIHCSIHTEIYQMLNYFFSCNDFLLIQVGNG